MCPTEPRSLVELPVGVEINNVVVVGASAAGVSAATALRRGGFAGRIRIVDGDPRFPYERPPLSKTLLSKADEGLRPIVPPETFADLEIELLLGAAVDVIEPDRSRVVLRDGTVVDADRIVLATGAEPLRLTVPGADLEHVMSLRDADDAEALAHRLSVTRSLVIIGAGFIGLELAAEARQNDMAVTVIDVADVPLQHAMGPQIGQLLQQLHEQRGVEFRLGAGVERLEGDGAVERVVLTDGTVVDADTVVVGVGVRARTTLAEGAGITIDAAGIVVDAHGMTSHPHVYAAGDVASQSHPALATSGRIEHWDSAIRHGSAVGATIAGTPTSFDTEPFAWSDQYGLTFQLFGRPRLEDELVVQDGAVPERFIAFWFRNGRLSAVLGCDASRDVGMARRLLEGGYPLTPQDVRSDGCDLRGLHRALSRTVALTG